MGVYGCWFMWSLGGVRLCEIRDCEGCGEYLKYEMCIQGQGIQIFCKKHQFSF